MSTILDVLRKAQEDSRRRPPAASDPGEMLGDHGSAPGRAGRVQLLLGVGLVTALAAGLGLALGSRLRGEPPAGSPSGSEVASPASEAAAPAARPAAAPATEPGSPDAARAAPPALDLAAPPAAAEPSAASPASVAGAQPARAKPATGGGGPAAAAPTAQGGAGSQMARAAVPTAGEVATDRGRAPVVGEKRPAPYLEPRIGPSGVAEAPRLRPVPRPREAAQDRVARAGAEREAMVGFRDREEGVRVGSAPVVAPQSAPRPAERDSAGSGAAERPAQIATAQLAGGDEEPLARFAPGDDAEPAGAAQPALPGSIRAERERIASATDPAGEHVAVPAPAEPELAAAQPALAPPAAADALASALRRSPSGLPQVTINLVQWSAAATRRFAYVRVDGSAMTQVREGDQIGGLTVRRILEQAIEFGYGESSFLLRAN